MEFDESGYCDREVRLLPSEVTRYTNALQLLGINRRNHRRSSQKWWPYGCYLWPHPSQHILHGNLRITRRTSLLHALRRRRILLVLGFES